MAMFNIGAAARRSGYGSLGQPQQAFYAMAYMDAADIAYVYQTLLDIELAYLRIAKNTPAGPLRNGYLTLANRAKTIMANFERQLEKLSVDIALKSESEIRRRIRKTRVRSSAGRRPRLEDTIKSIAVPTSPNIGFVGMGEIESLNQAINPFDRSAQPFWRAQEYGLDAGFVGRQVRGFFFGSVADATSRSGGSPPDPTQFRQHPVFRAGGGARMTVQRPIKARHFLRDGTAVAGATWMRRYKQIEKNVLVKGLQTL